MLELLGEKLLRPLLKSAVYDGAISAEHGTNRAQTAAGQDRGHTKVMRH